MALVLGPTRVKAFPLGRRVVLLPQQDRRTAALGICMYTGSKSWVILGQRLACSLVGRLGSRVLPGHAERWTPPYTLEETAALTSQWESVLGRVDGWAVYRRKQRTRTGLTILLTSSGAPHAVVKVRDDASTLNMEQEALAAVEQRRPKSFRSPTPLGSGTVHDSLHWSAQTAVFTRPHNPVLQPPDGLFAEVSDSLKELLIPSPSMQPSHNDLTPWNLRRDHTGQTWLFDWEDCGLAPIGSDRTYFAASSSALGAGPVPGGLPAEAIAHWQEIVTARAVAQDDDHELAAAMHLALTTAAARSS